MLIPPFSVIPIKSLGHVAPTSGYIVGIMPRVPLSELRETGLFAVSCPQQHIHHSEFIFVGELNHAYSLLHTLILFSSRSFRPPSILVLTFAPLPLNILARQSLY